MFLNRDHNPQYTFFYTIDTNGRYSVTTVSYTHLDVYKRQTVPLRVVVEQTLLEGELKTCWLTTRLAF